MSVKLSDHIEYELTNIEDSWQYAAVKCDSCGFKWTAQYPEGCELIDLSCLECGEKGSARVRERDAGEVYPWEQRPDSGAG